MFTKEATDKIIIDKINIAENAILELRWMLTGHSDFCNSVDDLAMKIANLRSEVPID